MFGATPYKKQTGARHYVAPSTHSWCYVPWCTEGCACQLALLTILISSSCLCGSEGTTCAWEFEMVPDTRKTNFSRWVGLLVHCGALEIPNVACFFSTARRKEQATSCSNLNKRTANMQITCCCLQLVSITLLRGFLTHARGHCRQGSTKSCHHMRQKASRLLIQCTQALESSF